MRLYASIAAALLIAITASVHSIKGEQRLIAYLRRLPPETLPPRVMRALRFTWHEATMLMLVTAAALVWPGTPRGILLLIGALYLGLGAVALWLTKGRHISGPMFTGAGVLALAAPFLDGGP